jgi:glycosyltransferase involved in cell wall biosynthesis
MIASFGTVTVITRANNRDAIEAALPVTAERDNLEFVYVDLPAWARSWKRGVRGIHLYYLLWQIAAVRTARRLHRAQPFEVVWHVTLANAWMGSMASQIAKEFVWGPIGGGVRTPRRLFSMLSARGVIKEVTYAVLQYAGHFNPFVRTATKRARLILVQNPETRDWIAGRDRHKAVVFPNAVIAPPERTRDRRVDSHIALFAGQLVPGKGVSLAVRSLVHLPDWRLVICGDGPEERSLRRLARTIGVEDRVVFNGWVSRSEVARIMVEDADVFVFPSLHDQSPWVLHEARAVGLPVVALEGCGSSLLATVTVRPGSPGATARALAEGVQRASSQPMPSPESFDIDTRRQQLERVLRGAGLPLTAMRSQ